MTDINVQVITDFFNFWFYYYLSMICLQNCRFFPKSKICEIFVWRDTSIILCYVSVLNILCTLLRTSDGNCYSIGINLRIFLIWTLVQRVIGPRYVHYLTLIFLEVKFINFFDRFDQIIFFVPKFKTTNSLGSIANLK